MHLFITLTGVAGAAKAKVSVDEIVLMKFRSLNYISLYSYRFHA